MSSQLRKIGFNFIATFCFVGYLPLIPGTFGSLAGVALFYLFKADILYCGLALAFLLVLGFLASPKIERLLNKKDPGCIVIDEVCGMLIALSFMPLDIKIVVLGFMFFRILDMLKPYPAGLVQEIRGGAGVMGDDIVAGVYTNIILQLLLRFFSAAAPQKFG